MRLERVLFPEDTKSSWGNKASNCLGDISNRRDKTKAARGKRQRQKHGVGKSKAFVSVLMNLDGNNQAKRAKKTGRSSKKRSDVKETNDSLSRTLRATQSSRPINDSNTSIHFISDSLILQSLGGATESLLFLGGINGNARKPNVAKSKSSRKSGQIQNKPGQVSKRARSFMTKLIQGTDSDGIVRDKRLNGSQSDKTETSETSGSRNIMQETNDSKLSLQKQQQKARRPKRQRDCTGGKLELQDTQELHVEEPVEPVQKKRDDNVEPNQSKPVRGKRVKFSEQNERCNRRKDKLEVSCGGLGALCGLNSNGTSFPVPNPVLNRSVLVSPLTVESPLESNGRKDGGKCSKKAKKSSCKRKGEANAKTKDKNIHTKRKATKSSKPSKVSKTKKSRLPSMKQDENNETTQMPPKEHGTEQGSLCASFSAQSPEVVTEAYETAKQVLSTLDGDLLLYESVSGLHKNRGNTRSLETGALSTKNRVAKSRRLISLSHTWELDSSGDTSKKRDASSQEVGKYVIEVEEAELPLLHKTMSGSFEQRHQVAKASIDQADCEKVAVLESRRSDLTVEVDVEPSPRSEQERKPIKRIEKGKNTDVEPTPRRRSPRLRASNNSDSDKENFDTQANGVRRSRRSVGRPSRLGVYEAEDDSTYVPTPSANSTSKKRRKSVTLVEKHRPKPKSIEEEQEEQDPETNTIQWKENEVLLLREAQKEVDPKSYSYWQDVADLVGTRSAEECQEKWYSLAKTPNVRQRKKQGRENLKEIPMSPQDDDIFDATPMKALFSKSSTYEDPMLGSIEFLSQFNLGSAVKVERVPVVGNESNTLATTRGYKSYIRDMRREVLAKDKKMKPRLPPKQKNSKIKNVREQAGEGDIEVKGRLSPGGTIHMTSNIDEDIDMGHDMEEESDDDDPFFPRIQA